MTSGTDDSDTDSDDDSDDDSGGSGSDSSSDDDSDDEGDYRYEYLYRDADIYEGHAADRRTPRRTGFRLMDISRLKGWLSRNFTPIKLAHRREVDAMRELRKDLHASFKGPRSRKIIDKAFKASVKRRKRRAELAGRLILSETQMGLLSTFYASCLTSSTQVYHVAEKLMSSGTVRTATSKKGGRGMPEIHLRVAGAMLNLGLGGKGAQARL
jgi:hypothetical protein